MALGMVAPELFDLVIADQSVVFGKDDVLVLYTDGVTEALNAEGEEFSSGRLADSLKYLWQHSPKEMNQGILANVKSFAGTSAPYDDITLVTIKHL
jgi:sigma-B regulation protein RsbU (phosphoserine phosphatase)